MFQEKREYPTAYTDDSLDPDQADAWAVAWALAQQEKLGGEILLLTPSASVPAQHPNLDYLLRHPGTVQASWRTLMRKRWAGGPVIAAWPDEKVLAEIAGDRRTSALCALTWRAKEIKPWALATGATCLSDNPSEAVLPEQVRIDDRVVERAMQTVTRLINQNNTLSSHYEKAVAAGALLELKKHGHELSGNELYSWALANGWRPKRALELKALVKQITSGSRPQIRRPILRDDVYQTWLADAEEDD